MAGTGAGARGGGRRLARLAGGDVQGYLTGLPPAASWSRWWWCPVIVALLLVPLAGTLVLGALALRPSTADGPVPRWTAVVVAAVTLALSVALLPGSRAPPAAVDPRHEVDVSWIPAIDVRFPFGVDGISLPLVVLTALLTLLCTVHASARCRPRAAGRLPRLLLLLEVGLLGTFLALDLVLFFVSFEVVLAPMYFLIALWGGRCAAARHAATKFVLYTLLGSVFVLVGILPVYAPPAPSTWSSCPSAAAPASRPAPRCSRSPRCSPASP